MRQPVNTWTHFVTFLAALVGMVALLVLSRGSASALITMSIYGSSVILLYGASSLYHWVSTTPGRQLVLRKLDHVAIFLLIAGTYTPVLYYGLEGWWRWSMLAAVWTLAATGVFLKLWFIHAPRFVSTAFYLALGWLAVVPLSRLVHTLPGEAVAFMAAGGVAYTLGAVIYALRWPDFLPGRLGFHEVFHLFTSTGSVLHFVMMLYLLPT
ncbi:MAG: hemolysin III family protein [Syntrophomonadaceae bacterium]|jgi:hemolysin III|nr:hemolysin III family protein [Syntrophomonadaceae bacterium]MDH7497559.1 hemolysin III family protein [Syntrophomonadaceae bacterium]